MVVGHYRGARVGHRWALDRPGQVERLAVLDIVPTREMFRRLDASLASGYWHWLFHMQPDLPERLVGHDIRGYLEYFFERWTYNRHGVTADAVDGYVRAFSRPGALRASLDDYRAVEEDTALDDIDAAEGHRLTMPLLALWGSVGLPARLPTLEILHGERPGRKGRLKGGPAITGWAVPRSGLQVATGAPVGAFPAARPAAGPSALRCRGRSNATAAARATTPAPTQSAGISPSTNMDADP